MKDTINNTSDYGVKSEDHAGYLHITPAVTKSDTEDNEQSIINAALAILRSRMQEKGTEFTSPDTVKNFLQLEIADLEHEVFGVLFLDTKHRLISFDKMFRGTIDGSSVHPREVVKEALKYNASAVILSHNHPSNNPEPSRADIAITGKLKDALDLIDVRVLDHVVVSRDDAVSMAELGYL